MSATFPVVAVASRRGRFTIVCRFCDTEMASGQAGAVEDIEAALLASKQHLLDAHGLMEPLAHEAIREACAAAGIRGIGPWIAAPPSQRLGRDQ
ncbi:MAG: hypothetical protein QJR08_00225 [Bacillota bacterium]|nr:hypothetical protein [Bacillota bacterium]